MPSDTHKYTFPKKMTFTSLLPNVDFNMSKENELLRSANEIGLSISGYLKTKLTEEVNSGRLEIGKSEFTKLLGLVEQYSNAALVGSMKTFYAKFDEYKKEKA